MNASIFFLIPLILSIGIIPAISIDVKADYIERYSLPYVLEPLTDSQIQECESIYNDFNSLSDSDFYNRYQLHEFSGNCVMLFEDSIWNYDGSDRYEKLSERSVELTQERETVLNQSRENFFITPISVTELQIPGTFLFKFEGCTGDQTIKANDISVVSDKETVLLTKFAGEESEIPPGTCNNLEIQIGANDPSSIKVVVASLGVEVSAKIDEVTTKIDEVTTKIDVVTTKSDSIEAMSPYQQIKNGVAAEDVECKELFKLMIRPNGNPACVDKKSIHPLEFWDWTLRITTDINKLDGLNWYEPENRNLGFRNIDKVVPFPVEISKGSGPVHEFGSDPQDLSKIQVEYYDKIITLDEYLEQSHTDAFLVLNGNDIVYEKYLRMDPNERHHIQSTSKTISSALLGNHVVNGDVDLNKKMKEYFPDIGSGYAEATLQQVLDMHVTNEFSFDFDDHNAHIHQYEVAAGFKPDIENKWPDGHRGFIKTNIASDDTTGKESSQYQDPNTDIVAWVLEDTTGEKYYTLFEERIYQHLGAEQDAVVITDVQGNAFAAGGWYMTLRDLAKYASVWMNEGVAPDGERVIPLEWVNELRDNTKGPYYRGYEEVDIRYHNQMTTDGIFLAHAGWSGQFLYVDPDAKVAYVMFSSLTEANGGVQEDKNAMYEVGMAISDHFTDKYLESYLTN